MNSTLMSRALLAVAVVMGLFVFFKNAWVSDDAYIIFRSIDQLLQGNGPVWNPHERVQVYTSPLWYGLLALAGTVSSDHYLNVIVVSLSAWCLCLAIMWRMAAHSGRLLLWVMLLVASTAFFDYTSSGLENVLAYLVVLGYLWQYSCLFRRMECPEVGTSAGSSAVRVLLLFGVMLCVRLDLGLLLFPPTVYALARARSLRSRRSWVYSLALSLAPIFLFTLFCLVYYGFPVGNPAYAKLGGGVDRASLVGQGLNYLLSSLRHDSATVLVILLGVTIGGAGFAGRHYRAVALGIVAFLAYVVFIGGDFMQGRFLSVAYLVGATVLVSSLQRVASPRPLGASLVMASLYLSLYPHTPLTSPFDYSSMEVEDGIADERGFYFEEMSLHAYLQHQPSSGEFPRHSLAAAGEQFREDDEVALYVYPNVGIFGYRAGTEKIIVDPLGLTDPLLARLPAASIPRVGHFERTLPGGYVKSILSEGEALEDPRLDSYNSVLKIATQGEVLFSWERLWTIVKLNVGAYDDLLPAPTL